MLLPLLRKEVKELLMEKSILIGIVIIPLIMFPIMGALTSLGVGAAAQKTMGGLTIGIADFDQTNLTSKMLPQMLAEEDLHIMNLSCATEDECIQVAQAKNLEFLIIIPSGFTRNFTAGVRGVVEAIYFIKSFTVSDLTISGKISSALLDAFRALAEKIHGREVNPEFFQSPISQESLVIYFGKKIRAPIEALGSAFLTVLIGLPLVAVVIASYASSIAATSIALEKESKTLEVLLTMPVSRVTILLSKLLGTFLIVLLGTISFIVGFGIYSLMFAGTMVSISPTPQSTAVSLKLPPIQPSPVFVPILLIAIFVTMIMTTCIGLLVGILGSDVRSAQQLVGAISFPLLMPPFFILMFASFDALPLGIKIALLADPFTHLFLAIQSGFIGDLASSLFSLGLMIGYTAFLLLLSSWLFMGERLITMRVSVKRKVGEEKA